VPRPPPAARRAWSRWSRGRGAGRTRLSRPPAGQPVDQPWVPPAPSTRTSTFRPTAAVRELGQRRPEHGDVVIDGVGARIAAPQQDRQRLPAALGSVVKERVERMEAETPLERRGGQLLLRVRGHQRGVHVDDQRPRGLDVVIRGVLAGQRPRPRTGRGPGGIDRRQCRGSVGGQGVDQPGHRRIRGHRAEHLRMRPQLGDVGQAVPANDIARSSTILPGSWRANGRRHGASAALNAESSPTVVAVRVNSTPPAPETTFRPCPSTARRR